MGARRPVPSWKNCLDGPQMTLAWVAGGLALTMFDQMKLVASLNIRRFDFTNS